MLVPQLVREKLPTAIIGVFHARCFPSSEMFQYLSVREHPTALCGSYRIPNGQLCTSLPPDGFPHSGSRILFTIY
jgi:hypothetical protein